MINHDHPTVPPAISYSPGWAAEGWDDDHDRPVIEGARWDVNFECAIGIWHDHEFEGVPEYYSISVSVGGHRSTHISRAVTPGQIREFAHHLLTVVGDQP